MLDEDRIKQIEAEVEQAATAHLNARDFETALNHFTEDVVAVSNTAVFSGREALSVDVAEYYRILKKVNHAAWQDVHIHVITENAASFTAKFSYGFTDVEDKVIELEGVWTALFERIEGDWKMRLRHESFEQK
ncbi:MAG: nuclear transport factor 2 family protein [Chromatiales bacterium]|jgi:ketosteroid isomerase-like protein